MNILRRNRLVVTEIYVSGTNVGRSCASFVVTIATLQHFKIYINLGKTNYYYASDIVELARQRWYNSITRL